MPELICKILHIGKTTYYKYLNNNFPIILFLKSLKKEELLELHNEGKIKKFDLIKNFTYEELKEKLEEHNKEKIHLENLKHKLYTIPNLEGGKISILIYTLENHNFQNKDEFISFISNIKQNLFTTILKSIFSKKGDIDRYILNKKILELLSQYFLHSWTENEIKQLYIQKEETLIFLRELSKNHIL